MTEPDPVQAMVDFLADFVGDDYKGWRQHANLDMSMMDSNEERMLDDLEYQYNTEGLEHHFIDGKWRF